MMLNKEEMTMENNEVMNVANEVVEAAADIPAEVVVAQPTFGVGDYVVAGLAGVGAGAIIGGSIFGIYKLVKHIQKKKADENVAEENPAPEAETEDEPVEE